MRARTGDTRDIEPTVESDYLLQVKFHRAEAKLALVSQKSDLRRLRGLENAWPKGTLRLITAGEWSNQ